MKFTLYGDAQGVCGQGNSAYVTVLEDTIMDCSVSASKGGVQVGWPLRTALALMPNLDVLEHPELPTPCMQSVYQALWHVSPFLSTVNQQAFFLQIPSDHPPLREVRKLLLQLDGQLTNEQRFRAGLAENPFLAQALVSWSRLERVPGALYLRVNRQQLIVSPALGSVMKNETSEGDTSWIEEIPIAALWVIPRSIRMQLEALGIHRLKALKGVSDTTLAMHFGKESRLWRRMLSQEAGGKVPVNYPPVERRISWRAPLGEDSSTAVIDSLLDSMATTLCTQLGRVSAGALGLGLSWRTELGRGEFEQVARQPVYQPFPLLAQLQKGRSEILGERLEALDLYVFDLRPLQSVQSGFVLYQDAFYPASSLEKAQISEVREQLVKKFPTQLHMGAKPTFREQRLAVIQGGVLHESHGS